MCDSRRENDEKQEGRSFEAPVSVKERETETEKQRRTRKDKEWRRKREIL